MRQKNKGRILLSVTDLLHIAIISDESIKPVSSYASNLSQKISNLSTKESEACHANRDISKSYDVESNKKLPSSDALNITENIQKSAIKESKTYDNKRQLSKPYTIDAKIKISCPNVPKVSHDMKRPIAKDPEIKSNILKPSMVSTISR